MVRIVNIVSGSHCLGVPTCLQINSCLNFLLSGGLQELQNKGKAQLGNRLKSGCDRLRERLLTRAYYKVKLHSSNGISHRWSFLVAYQQSGHRDSFDCMILGILTSLSMLEVELIRIEI